MKIEKTELKELLKGSIIKLNVKENLLSSFSFYEFADNDFYFIYGGAVSESEIRVHWLVPVDKEGKIKGKNGEKFKHETDFGALIQLFDGKYFIIDPFLFFNLPKNISFSIVSDKDIFSNSSVKHNLLVRTLDENKTTNPETIAFLNEFEECVKSYISKKEESNIISIKEKYGRVDDQDIEYKSKKCLILALYGKEYGNVVNRGGDAFDSDSFIFANAPELPKTNKSGFMKMGDESIIKENGIYTITWEVKETLKEEETVEIEISQWYLKECIFSIKEKMSADDFNTKKQISTDVFNNPGAYIIAFKRSDNQIYDYAYFDPEQKLDLSPEELTRILNEIESEAKGKDIKDVIKIIKQLREKLDEE